MSHNHGYDLAVAPVITSDQDTQYLIFHSSTKMGNRVKAEPEYLWTLPKMLVCFLVTPEAKPALVADLRFVGQAGQFDEQHETELTA